MNEAKKLFKKIDFLTKNVAALKTQIRQLTCENSELENQVTKNTETIITLAKKQGEGRQIVEAVRRENEGKEKRLKELQELFDSLKTEKAVLCQEMAEKEKEFKEASFRLGDKLKHLESRFVEYVKTKVDETK